MTADNSFECWINGKKAGSGDTWQRPEILKLTKHIKPGINILTVAAKNGGTGLNPAGLLAALEINYNDHPPLEIITDASWKTATTTTAAWTTARAETSDWIAAVELGPADMAPWGGGDSPLPAPRLFASSAVVGNYLSKSGVPADFTVGGESDLGPFRFIHRTLDDHTEVYFVANKDNAFVSAPCSFRVDRRTPELWWPDTGKRQPVAQYEQTGGCTTVPLQLDSYGSVFVVFRTDDHRPEPVKELLVNGNNCLLYTSPSPRDS